MKLRSSAVDPESFRGKLYLLVIDKVVIGALIAIAFLVYDRWKTQEVRHYTTVQEETQLGFKRAEYVKQLVPIVLDGREDIQYRAHAFSALVETNSIDANSSVRFAQMLLDSNVLGTYQYGPTNPLQNEKYFLATMLKTMPAGLPALLTEYANSLAIAPGRQNYGRYFWKKVFLETVGRYKDSELDVLESDRFLADFINVLYIINEYLSPTAAEEWSKRKLKGLRIIGSIRLFQSNREPNAYALSQLESAIDPMLDAGLFSLRKRPDHDPDALKLSTEVAPLGWTACSSS